MPERLSVGYDLNVPRPRRRDVKVQTGFSLSDLTDVVPIPGVKELGRTVEGIAEGRNVGDVLEDQLESVTSSLPVVSTAKNVYDAGKAIIEGGRVDRAALGLLKKEVANAATTARYAQSVASFVPGVGTGVSAGLGAGLALAEGKSIDQIALEAVKGAIPGGPLAQAALAVAVAAAQGQPIEELGIAALPIPDQQKQAVRAALAVVKDVADGKPVDRAVLDNADKAIALLPPDVQKAVTVGVALGQATLVQAASRGGSVATMNTPRPVRALVSHTVSTAPKPQTAAEWYDRWQSAIQRGMTPAVINAMKANYEAARARERAAAPVRQLVSHTVSTTPKPQTSAEWYARWQDAIQRGMTVAVIKAMEANYRAALAKEQASFAPGGGIASFATSAPSGLPLAETTPEEPKFNWTLWGSVGAGTLALAGFLYWRSR